MVSVNTNIKKVISFFHQSWIRFNILIVTVFVSFLSSRNAYGLQLCNKTPSEVYGEVAGDKCCWFVEPLEGFFKLADKVGEACYKALVTESHFVTKITSLGFAFWLAFQVLKFVSPLYGQDHSDFFMTLGKGLFRFITVIAFLETPYGYELFDLLVGTVIKGAADLGTGLLGISPPPPSSSTGATAIYESISTLLVTAGEKFRLCMGYGKAIIYYSFDKGLLGDKLCVFPNFTIFFTGAVVFIFSGAFLILIPLKIVDMAFRLALLYALLPFFIASWAFPQTRKYTKVAWGMVMYIVVFFIVMAMLTAVSIAMLSSIEPEKLETAGNLGEIYSQFATETEKKGFFAFVGMMFICIKLFGTTSELSGFVSGGSGGGLAESTFGNLGTSLAGKVGGTALAAVGGVFGWGKDKAKEKLKDAIRNRKEGGGGSPSLSTVARKYDDGKENSKNPLLGDKLNKNNSDDGLNIISSVENAQNSGSGVGKTPLPSGGTENKSESSFNETPNELLKDHYKKANNNLSKLDNDIDKSLNKAEDLSKKVQSEMGFVEKQAKQDAGKMSKDEVDKALKKMAEEKGLNHKRYKENMAIFGYVKNAESTLSKIKNNESLKKEFSQKDIDNIEKNITKAKEKLEKDSKKDNFDYLDQASYSDKLLNNLDDGALNASEALKEVKGVPNQDMSYKDAYNRTLNDMREEYSRIKSSIEETKTKSKKAEDRLNDVLKEKENLMSQYKRLTGK